MFGKPAMCRIVPIDQYDPICLSAATRLRTLLQLYMKAVGCPSCRCGSLRFLLAATVHVATAAHLVGSDLRARVDEQDWRPRTENSASRMTDGVSSPLLFLLAHNSRLITRIGMMCATVPDLCLERSDELNRPTRPDRPFGAT